MIITAVVVTYNRKQLLMECLNALLTQTYPLHEIVVFDNASTDGTKEAVEESGLLKNSVIKYIRHETNSGGAGGFYYGSRQAYKDGADWIWMMDDDCIPKLTALDELIKAADVVDAGFFRSAVFQGDVAVDYNKPSIDFNGKWHNYIHLGIVKIRRAPFISFFISRDAVEKCGLPYKNYFIWGDDTEYSYRISKYYKPGYFVGNSHVVHKVGKESSPWDSDQISRIKMAHYLVRNSLINAKEYSGFFSRAKLRVHYARLFFRIIFSNRKKKLLKLSQIIRGFWEYHIGTYDRKAFKNRFTNHI